MNKFKIFVEVILLTLVSFSFAYSQESAEKTRVQLGEVTVVGAQYADVNALKIVSGLREGKMIDIPDDTRAALKNLWKLKLFTDIKIVKKKTIGDVVFLEIQITERPRLYGHVFEGVKKSYHDDLNTAVKAHLTQGGIVTASALNNAQNAIKDFFLEKGYPDATVQVSEEKVEGKRNAVKLKFDIDRKERLKIQDITFSGNDNVKSSKLRRQLGETTRKKKFWKSSKFIPDNYRTDKEALLAYYNKLGYRDARITNDSIWREEDGDLRLHLTVDEGNRFFYRNIAWKGNSLYSSEQLSRVLGLGKGDVYNPELLSQRLSFSLEGNDVSALYMDDGYLFFRAEPIETAFLKDSVDVEVRIFEGPQATIDKVIIKGNDRTHEHVIRRELRTKPGDKFSRSDLIRSQRKLTALGYFNQENMQIGTPVDQQRGTVDIVYGLEEKSSDQLELSAGWQPGNSFYRGGLIGTLGLAFNNFSLRNLFKREAWHPLPMGDGQKLSIRAQTSGQYYQSYNFNFTEPWLGGKKPTAFSLSAFYTKSSDYTNTDNYLSIGQVSLGLGNPLKWPDENFILNTSLNFQKIGLNNRPGFFQLPNGSSVSTGSFNNFYLETALTRSTVYEPIFPKEGSIISLSVAFTPPYSSFKNGTTSSEKLQDKYKWVEYHKWNLKAEWYKQVFNKFVLKVAGKMGVLGYYDRDIGTSPFERFNLGAEPLQQQYTIQGQDQITLRGYEQQDFPAVGNGGASIYSKYTVELRYPFSTNPQATIFGTAFLEGGNAWNRFQDFNPFDIKRSVGVGFRVFLPMFGILGGDYGFGIDKRDILSGGGTQLGSQRKYGRFTVVLGFEPE